jgi:phosphoribosylformylglycinamidine cyclo-ligase
MKAGDVLIGVASSGVHSNGLFAGAPRRERCRALLRRAGAVRARDLSLGEALLAPTRLYVKSALAAIRAGGVKGLAHITGGGITENLPRALPGGLDAESISSAWSPPLPVFGWLSKSAGIGEREMLRTFNCGIGLIAVVAPEKADATIAAFSGAGESACRIGTLVRGQRRAKRSAIAAR